MVAPPQQKSNLVDYSKQPSNIKVQPTTNAPTASPVSTDSTALNQSSQNPQSFQPSAIQQPSGAKSKKWIWWTIGGVILLILIGLGIWFFLR